MIATRKKGDINTVHVVRVCEGGTNLAVSSMVERWCSLACSSILSCHLSFSCDRKTIRVQHGEAHGRQTLS